MRRCPCPRLRSALCAGALLAAAVTATPAAAQEVGAFASAARSDQTELRRPVGWGAYAAVSPLPFVKLRISYHEQSAGGRRRETVCDAYWPVFENCTPEGVRRDAWMRTVSVLVLGTVPVTRRLRVEAGAGRSRSRVTLDLRSESGRELGVFVPEDEEQPGTVLHAGAVLERVLGSRLAATVEAGRQEVEFDGCVQDVGAPFCGSSRFHELRMGVRYRFF
jgi:hypothetical protein